MASAPDQGFPAPPPGAAAHGRRGPGFFGRLFKWIGRVIVSGVLALNLLFLVLVGRFLYHAAARPDDGPPHERFYSGSRLARNKIAVVGIDGVIMEGMTSFDRRQIDQAATDDAVKAVVLRINSPGGSITASDDLHMRIRRLRDGDPQKQTSPKTVIVSMASLAASGGYYIAMPARRVLAERTTITGSIGVFAAFPNVTDLANQVGFRMDVIKAGAVKDSGSMFHNMTAEERQLWQGMVDHAYQQFLAVVREGRGSKLRYGLEDEIKEETRMIPDRDPTGKVLKLSDGKEKQVPFVRRLADGGIFTADQAKRYGLIDDIGFLDDALALARSDADLGADYQAIVYERPPPPFAWLLGARSPQPLFPLDFDHVGASIQPRLWYLAPQHGLSGLLTSLKRD
jgi:protease-4